MLYPDVGPDVVDLQPLTIQKAAMHRKKFRETYGNAGTTGKVFKGKLGKTFLYIPSCVMEDEVKTGESLGSQTEKEECVVLDFPWCCPAHR